MEDVYTYLKWRGDLTLSESPFNEIDSLILSLISYVNFDEIVPGTDSDKIITLKEASDLYFSLYTVMDGSTNKNKISFINKTPLLLKEVADTNRYSKIQIGKHINEIDAKKGKQFSATTFVLNDGSIYVAYRGTDATIVGWKEDFNMSFLPEVPAQKEAVKYLEETSDWMYRNIRIGGHSKGGNLAIYSGIKCNKQLCDRILSIHNFDGPGFHFDVINSTESNNLLSRITNYIPQASIIGMLLEHIGENKIIKSNQFGIMQHDSFSWEVGAITFPDFKELDKSSLQLDSIMKQWINKIELEERAGFVDILFGILEDTGIERTEDFVRITNDKIWAFLKSIRSLPSEKKQLLSKALKLFFCESQIQFKRNLKKTLINMSNGTD